MDSNKYPMRYCRKIHFSVMFCYLFFFFIAMTTTTITVVCTILRILTVEYFSPIAPHRCTSMFSELVTPVAHDKPFDRWTHRRVKILCEIFAKIGVAFDGKERREKGFFVKNGVFCSF